MELSNYARIFKALSNEQRLKIFLMIYGQPGDAACAAPVIPVKRQACCPLEKAFSKVCDCLDLSRSTISHHFKELQAAGLITCERDGQTFRCQVNAEAVRLLRGFLK